jgi:hypothetical protein
VLLPSRCNDAREVPNELFGGHPMTAQIADRLINKHPRVMLRGLQLYGVTRGDISANNGWGERYKFANPPRPPEGISPCSALWRGYIATFRLDQVGELELISYRYPFGSSKAKTQRVNEKLSGDFWLVFKHNFFGPRTYVPFKDGRIVEDESTWVIEKPRHGRKLLPRLLPAKQKRLDALMAQNNEGKLTPGEKAELQSLVQAAEAIMLANARHLAEQRKKSSS